MKNVLFGLIALLSLSLIITSCDKDDDNTITGTGELTIEFENLAGTEPLLFTKDYTIASGETARFSQFDYYVSNFVVTKSDGTEYTVPKDSCYFLIKHNESGTHEITLKNIPAGDYKSARFIIGVDSLKSVSDVSQRTGVLDPASGGAGMYWAWNSGYIFVKVEGTSPAAPLVGAERPIQYHTGLYGGKDSPTLNNIKTVTLSKSGEVAEVRKDEEAPHMHVYVNILEMFTNPTNVVIAENPTSHGGAYSKTIADNYVDMFVLDHIHNH